MAGITQTDWVATTVNGHLVLKCSLTQADTTLWDDYTKKTPKELDTTKPWILYVNTAGATLDAQSLPVDLWVGWDEDAALVGTANDVTATSCIEVDDAILDNVENGKLAIRIDPYYQGTAVKSATDAPGILNPGIVPYYIINLDGGSLLAQETCTIVITQ